MYRLLILIMLHSGADFLLQGSRLSKLKASKTTALFAHVGVYTGVFIIFSPLLLGLSFMQGLIFSLINGVLHLGIDFITSRLKKMYWNKNESAYFAVISFDHISHLAILIGTYIYMFPEVFSFSLI